MKQTKGNRNLVRFGALLMLVALWVITPFAIGDRIASAEELITDVFRIGATLTGGPIGGVTPVGFADYRVDDQGRRRLEVQGQSINLAAGTVLTISVNNAVVGQASVNQLQTIFFEIETNNGGTVPVITEGMPVQVSNGANVVFAGTFGTVTPTPSPTGSPTGTPSPSPTGSPTGTPSPPPTGTPNAGDLFAALTGPTINGILPNGFAQFEIHSSRLELEVQVRQVNLAGGTQLAVVVDNINVGSLVLSGGEARLRLRTDNGQTVPAVVVGSTIAVKNGGSNILTGTFMGFTGATPSPSPTASPSPGGTPGPTPSPSMGRSFESHLTGAGMQPPGSDQRNG